MNAGSVGINQIKYNNLGVLILDMTTLDCFLCSVIKLKMSYLFGFFECVNCFQTKILWKEVSLMQSVYFRYFIQDISCVSDNIGLTLFCQSTSSFILQHPPRIVPTFTVSHGATLHESCKATAISKQGNEDLINASFGGLGMQHSAPCILTGKAKYLLLHNILNGC